MANLVKKYAVADASRRVDLIYKYYSVFLKTVDGRISSSDSCLHEIRCRYLTSVPT